MLAFFRRITHSRVGLVITFAVLALIALAFAASDVTGLRPAGGASGSSIAKVGDTAIGAAELRRAAQDQYQAAQQENPGLTMAAFVAGGGVDAALERLVNGIAMEEFGHDQGMIVGKQLEDRQLASYPSLQGPDGKFSQTRYEGILKQQRLTDAGIRTDIARDVIARMLILPTIGASQMPRQLALPYANLLLERRTGQVGFIPTKAIPAGAAPTEAELRAWYTRQIARYSLPERRVIRYARVSPEAVRARAAPSEAEIAQAYQSQRATYLPTQKRTVTQVTVLDQKAAEALAAQVRGGTAIAAAARAAGLEPRTITGVEKPALATQTSPALADAAFAAAEGAVIGPVRGGIGFVVARVDAIEQVPGRTLAQARDEITAALTTRKTADLLGQIQDALNDAIDKDANFNELVADQKLQPQSTGAVTATGIDPQAPRPADPALAQVIAAGFAAAEGDAPTIVPTGTDGGFAVAALERIVPAAPRPFAAIRDTLAADFAADRAHKAARAIAASVVAKAGRGTALATALGETGLRLPPITPIAAPRAQLASNPRGAPPPLVLLFSMAPGTAKLLEAPDKSGWFVIKLDTITPGDATKQPRVIDAARSEIGRALGQEYVQQFTNAVRRAVGVSRNAEALAALKADLAGRGGSDQ